MKKIAIMGLGNMGQAILKGLLSAKTFDKEEILCFEKSEETSKKIKQIFDIVVEKDYKKISHSNYVLLAVKPQQMGDLLEQIKEYINDQVVISIAAGITVEFIKRYTGDKKIVRAMPNTPALVGKGVTGIFFSDKISNKEREVVSLILSSFGDTVTVDKEEDIDKITALSGSGPAYVFYLMEAFVDAGVFLGLTRETAKKLVLSTFSGSSYLAENSEKTITELKEMVTSPGGTTIYGLFELEKGSVKSTIIEAVNRAYKRAKELGSS